MNSAKQLTTLALLCSGLTLAMTATATGDDAQRAATLAENSAANTMTNALHNDNMPAWLKRTDIDLHFEENSKPTYAIETIQPLYMNTQSTWFTQGRAAYRKNKYTLNLGLGYRYLTNSKKWMWGVNGFYDFETKYNLRRLGLGGELFGLYSTVRANYYRSLNKTKKIWNGDSLTEVRVLSGYDYSLELPVPYIPWARLRGGGYHWDKKWSKDVNGANFVLHLQPFQCMETDVGLKYDDIEKYRASLALSFYLGTPHFLGKNMMRQGFSQQAFTARNLADYRLVKVERQNDILLETDGPKSGLIEIERGDN